MSIRKLDTHESKMYGLATEYLIGGRILQALEGESDIMATKTGQSVLEDKLFKYLNIGVLVTVNLLYLYLAVHRNFSYDEAYTVGMVNRDFADIFEVTSRDVHSPFYYIVLKIFYLFPGMGQLISTKIFSWIFMVFYLLGGVFPATKFMGER